MTDQGPGTPPPTGGSDGGEPPDLLEALRTLRDSGRASASAAGEAAQALRTLVAADISLARSAAGRSIAFAGVAVVFGASAWLLLMAGLIVLLSNQLGLPWWVSLLSCALLSGGGAWLAIRKADAYFEHTRLKATRRQLARLGIGELSDLTPNAGSAESARAAEQRLRDAEAKDRRGIDVTPP